MQIPEKKMTKEFDPIGNLTGNFKGLQNLLDSLNNAILGIGKNQSLLTPRLERNVSFAFQQLRPGQTASDLVVKGTQGTRVTDANRGLFVDVFGGRTRTFGSQGSLDAFRSRTGR